MKLKTWADALQLLEDMRDYAVKARRFSAGRGVVALEEDEAYRFSIFYPLQVVGEIAARVPEPVRELAPAIPWKLIVGFRHVVVHGYDAVRLDKVQSILDNELEPLASELDALILQVEAKGESPLL